MAAHANDDMIRCDPEERGVEDGEDEGEPGCEADEAGPVANAGVDVVVMLVELDGQPGGYGSCHGGEYGEENEGACTG